MLYYLFEGHSSATYIVIQTAEVWNIYIAHSKNTISNKKLLVLIQ